MTLPAPRISGFLAPIRDAAASDAELLDRFVTHRDGPAFAALVARHGPMVFGVCRRVLRDWHTAEDAFQATFLVLARKAASIHPPGAVAGWLHGVAYRVAKGARRTDLRMTARERPTAELPEPAAPTGPDTDLRTVLDDELRKLPSKYRDLLVACDLEERPRAPVAASLGIPEGTLSSRLTTARKLLARRLSKRGVAPAFTAGIALNGPSGIASEVPRAVWASAARFGSAAGTVPCRVSSLTKGVVRTMPHRVLRPIAWLLISTCGAIGVALAASGPPSPVSRVPTTKPCAIAFIAPPEIVPPRVAPKATPKHLNKLMFSRDGDLVMTDPDGTNQKQLLDGKKVTFASFLTAVAPDGTRACSFWVSRHKENRMSTILVVKLDDQDTGTDYAEDGELLRWCCWSADGTRLLISDADGPEPPDRFKLTHHVIDVATGKRTELDLPADHLVIDWARDGSFLSRVAVLDSAEKVGAWHLWLLGPDGKPKAEIRPNDKSGGGLPALHRWQGQPFG
ncbi:sigma-70 family RNA polymerase sigma factor [Frigoriglobus tundricola]|uniref:ECF RNA polymerase sigma factor SigE n=1 Tax=Frigoriglobus tundricola TaxID=2774151 RepID=A0A6M5YQ37_9BACT|nr:sigma-70 family RNA polymerase sigma factor [Frigoriglobus tundricola]QJW96157.1 hypothetical protein FTUN_3713 [Frigoriglobus tundricola]